jgi:phosphinothricin acetyltransferase
MQDDQRQENLAQAEPAGDAHAVIVRPSSEGDVEAMLAIYRHHIRRGVEDGVDDNGMLQPDDLRDRRKNLRDRRFPHLVATLRGDVIGYAYVVLFRKRPAYRYTVKHSIYIHHAHVGGGVGRLLLSELVDACAAAGFRQMIGYIDADLARAAREVRLLARRLPARRRLPVRPLGRQRHDAAFSRPRHDGAAAGVRLAALIRQLAWMNVPRMLGYTRIAGIDAGHDVFDRAVFADMHADVALLHISMTW